jgi:hypothetical protein
MDQTYWNDQITKKREKGAKESVADTRPDKVALSFLLLLLFKKFLCSSSQPPRRRQDPPRPFSLS